MMGQPRTLLKYGARKVVPMMGQWWTKHVAWRFMPTPATPKAVPTPGGADPCNTQGGADPCNTQGGADPCNTQGGADPCNTQGGADPCNTQGGADPSQGRIAYGGWVLKVFEASRG